MDSPLLLATWAVVVMVSGALFRTAGALGRAANVRLEVAGSLARTAAETAAIRHLTAVVAGGVMSSNFGDVRVSMHRRGDDCIVASTVEGRTWYFTTRELPGAAPEAFAHAFSVADPALANARSPQPAHVGAPPALEPRVLERAGKIETFAAVRRDRGVALLTWETGTDRDDFVFDPARATADVLASRELVVVPGHLWLECGDDPLRLALTRDLVLVVRGNLYLGRSLLVEGPGRLVLVAAGDPDAPVLVDADGDGRWSVGEPVRRGRPAEAPTEGSGNVYFGLPGRSAPIVLDAGIVVGGEAHLGVEARVRGPVALANGATPLRRATNPRLIPEGRWRFLVERERVPGFSTSGGVRPALLVRCASAPEAPDQQGLYLSSPAR